MAVRIHVLDRPQLDSLGRREAGIPVRSQLIQHRALCVWIREVSDESPRKLTIVETRQLKVQGLTSEDLAELSGFQPVDRVE